MFLPLIIALTAAVYFPFSASQVTEGRVDLFPGVTFSGERYASIKQRGSFGYVYYGIRYGTAKRFEASVENQDFSYLRNASRVKAGPVCPQRSNAELGVTSANQIQDEDCLYLDIYVPPLTANIKTRLPVMMWIYGGGFQIGDKDTYNSSSLADDIGAIIVTINYRVSIFGFLSTGDSAARGNYGLGDCKLALQWITKNIVKFGGNPQMITVFGESAGAVATSALVLDPTVRGAIRAGISFSGSTLMDLAWIRDPQKNAVELAKKVGCPTSTSREFITCLRRLPTQRLLSQAKQFAETPTEIAPYGIVVDGIHMRSNPVNAVLTAAGSAINGPNLITGYLREDFSLLLYLSSRDLFDPRTPLTLSVIRNIVARRFLRSEADSKCPEAKYALAESVMAYYNFSAADNRNVTLLKLFHLSTDSVFGYPAAKESLLYAGRRRSTTASNQVFRISYDPSYQGLGAFHGFDLPNIFFPEMRVLNLRMNPRVVSSIRKMLQQVAHNGRMDAPNFDQTGQYIELNQSGDWERGTYSFSPMVQFWDQVSKAACPTTG